MNPKINCIDYMNKISFGISIAFCVLYSCTSRTGQKTSEETLQADSLAQDTIAETVAEPVVKRLLRKKFKSPKSCCMINTHWKIHILIKIRPAVSNGTK